MAEPEGMTQEERAAWEAASEQDRLRSSVSVAELAEADRQDPDTPDDFDIDLTPFDRLFLEANSIDPEHARPSRPLEAGQSWNVDAMRKVAALLRSWGWTVLESPGWETRGVEGIELRARYIVVHHTAAPVDIDRILRDGRLDLLGPLCNFGIHLNSDIVLIAAGKANHAGVASISSSVSWGIESTGPVPTGNTGRDAFPNYRAQVALCVAIRIVEGWTADSIRAHKEIALPDGRKPDPAFEEGQPGDGYPAPYPEMDRFRNECRVAEVLSNPTPEEKFIVDDATKQDLSDLFDERLKAHFPATGGLTEKIANRTRQIIATGALPYGLDSLRAKIEAGNAGVVALAKEMDLDFEQIKSELDQVESELSQHALDEGVHPDDGLVGPVELD